MSLLDEVRSPERCDRCGQVLQMRYLTLTLTPAGNRFLCPECLRRPPLPPLRPTTGCPACRATYDAANPLRPAYARGPFRKL